VGTRVPLGLGWLSPCDACGTLTCTARRETLEVKRYARSRAPYPAPTYWKSYIAHRSPSFENRMFSLLQSPWTSVRYLPEGSVAVGSSKPLSSRSNKGAAFFKSDQSFPMLSSSSGLPSRNCYFVSQVGPLKFDSLQFFWPAQWKLSYRVPGQTTHINCSPFLLAAHWRLSFHQLESVVSSVGKCHFVKRPAPSPTYGATALTIAPRRLVSPSYVLIWTLTACPKGLDSSRKVTKNRKQGTAPGV
jgi:hypothetical protein